MQTENDRIFVAQMGQIDTAEICRKLSVLIRHAFDESRDIRKDIRKIVPEYKNQNEQAG